jgi:hypothetical protein
MAALSSEEGVERIHYTNLLKDSKEALSVGEELKLLVEAESLKYPTDKQDVVSRRKKAEEKFFGNEIVSLIKDAKDAKGNLGLIVDRLINLVGFGAPSDKSAIGGPLAIVAKRLRTAARTKPDDVIMAANKSRESEALLRSTGAARVAITADLSAAWETAWGMKMNTSIAKASRMLASKPKDAYGLVWGAKGFRPAIFVSPPSSTPGLRHRTCTRSVNPRPPAGPPRCLNPHQKPHHARAILTANGAPPSCPGYRNDRHFHRHDRHFHADVQGAPLT